MLNSNPIFKMKNIDYLIRTITVRLIHIIVIVLNKVGHGRLNFVNRFFSKIVDILIPKREIQISIEGFKFVYSGRDRGMGHSLFITGKYEQEETDFIKSILKPHMTYVNIGANFGYYSILAAKNVKTVYAFEPEPYNYSLVEKNIKLNELDNVVVEKLAISNNSNKTLLFKDEANFGNPSLSKKNIMTGHSSTEVKTTTIDEYFKDKPVIDVLQMDTQGNEAAILEKAELVFKNCNKIVFEFWPYGLKNMESSPLKLLQTLHSKGYSISEIDKILKPIEPNNFLTLIDKLENQKSGRGFTTLYAWR